MCPRDRPVTLSRELRPSDTCPAAGHRPPSCAFSSHRPASTGRLDSRPFAFQGCKALRRTLAEMRMNLLFSLLMSPQGHLWSLRFCQPAPGWVQPPSELQELHTQPSPRPTEGKQRHWKPAQNPRPPQLHRIPSPPEGLGRRLPRVGPAGGGDHSSHAL